MADLKIGTHDGTFHCDEVLACYMLRRLPKYKSAEIVRTRDPLLLDSCDLVVDVGGVYDPSTHRYDHHQKDFKECMNSLCPTHPWKTKLSSAGLVYHHFGYDIIRAVLGRADEEVVKSVYYQVYEHFIQEVDGIDNGVPMYDGEPSYRITTNLSSRVANLNPHWNSSEVDGTGGFYSAYEMVGCEFEDRVRYKADIWWPARDLVRRGIEGRFELHQSGEIIEFPNGRSCPWKEHLFGLETQLMVEPTIKFVLFVDRGKWRVMAVPVGVGSFVLRVPLAVEWRGLRGEELSTVAGIDGCIFVHSSGFIGGNSTRDGAFLMAVQSLKKRDEAAAKGS